MPSAEAGGDRRGSEAADGGRADPAFHPIAEETVFRGFIFSVAHGTFGAPDGSRFERDIVRHPGAVAVVAVTDEEAVVLVRQYRAPVDGWILEIPAGTRDVDGEPAAETAARELAEEAGYRADRLTLLAQILNTPGFCDESTGIYLATGLTPLPPARHGVEEQYMTVERHSLPAALELIRSGEITDAKTIVGLYWAQIHLS